MIFLTFNFFLSVIYPKKYNGVRESRQFVYIKNILMHGPKSIQKVVQKARDDFENRNISSDLLCNLYLKYDSGIDIVEFLRQASEIFPKLNCGLASIYLRHILKEGEIVQGSYKMHNHTFLKIENLIVDITADQFGGPKIYIGPLKSPWSFKPRKDII